MLRWDPYFTKKNEEVTSFLSSFFSSENCDLLYFSGVGFDPRMTLGLESIFSHSSNGRKDCIMVEFEEGKESPSRKHEALLIENVNKAKQIVEGYGGSILQKTVEMWKGQGSGRRRVTSQNAAALIKSIDDLEYDSIVVDISSLPRSVFFPLIGKILSLLDDAKKRGEDKRRNLLIVAAENAALDKQIRKVGIDDAAEYVRGFGSGFDLEGSGNLPRIWIPILGEDQTDQLRKVHELVNPDEISPVLPNPSINPRRSDDIVLSHRQLLFDEWDIEPHNIIYVSENNPFEAYRQISLTAERYRKALDSLGGCNIAISAHSSKLLSLGGLMAAYELNRKGYSSSLAHVQVQGYDMPKTNNLDELDSQSQLFLVGLFGEFYD